MTRRNNSLPELIANLRACSAHATYSKLCQDLLSSAASHQEASNPLMSVTLNLSCSSLRSQLLLISSWLERPRRSFFLGPLSRLQNSADGLGYQKKPKFKFLRDRCYTQKISPLNRWMSMLQIPRFSHYRSSRTHEAGPEEFQFEQLVHGVDTGA
jgi:hypothetical protein